MTDTAGPNRGWRWPRMNFRGWRNRKVSDPGFQSWASANVLTRGTARKEGEALFDLVAGFVHSQVLFALVELDLLRALRDQPRSSSLLATQLGIPEHRVATLCRAAVALDLMEMTSNGFQTSRLGAATLGVPGLLDMIRHHTAFYRDMADPVSVLRGESETELAQFWPYVFGAGAAEDPETADRYSRLMADSQGLVAEETLRAVDMSGITRLMDVGGGTGAFLEAVGNAHSGMHLTLFDLPAVVGPATERFSAAALTSRSDIIAGSFRDDPLPMGSDAISLIRVLYDHSDETVSSLLKNVRAALPAGGHLIVSEPMTGGLRPTRAGDAYFGFYCMAMQTGRARSAEEVASLISDAGFKHIKTPRVSRPFITSVVTAIAD